MNNTGYFQSLWLYLWGLIKQSFVYRILRRCYDGISGAWQRSAITNVFRREHFAEGCAESSVIGKILFSPFTFLNWLKKKFGAGLKAKVETSRIMRICNIYLEKLTARDPVLVGVLLIIAALAAVAGFVFGGADAALKAAVAAIAVFAGLFVVFLILKSTLAGVYITVFLAPLAPTMAMVGLVGLCFVSVLYRALTDDDFKWRTGGVGFLMLGFLAVYLIASLNSFAMINSLSIFAIYLVFMLFYFVVINTARTKKQLFSALTVFAVSGVIVCLYGIAQYVFGWDASAAWIDDEMFSDIKMRVYSTLENPNVLGEYILLVLPICAALMWQKPKTLSKLVFAVFTGVLLVTLILTFSRGCWIGAMVIAGLFVTFVCGKIWGLALIALPFVPMVLPESIINRFLSVGDMKDSSTSYRVYIWMGSLAMVKDFWASGIGPGTEAFKAVYPFYSYSGIVAPHSHNMFLQILVESGIVGIGVFLTTLFMFGKTMIDGYQATEKKGSALGTMIVAICTGVIGFAVQGMFDNCFYNYRVFLIFWFTLALGISAVNIAKSEKAVSEND